MGSDRSPDTQSEYVEIGTIDTNPKVDFAEYTSSGKGLASSARVTSDGRIVVSLDLRKHLPELPDDGSSYAQDVKEFAVDEKVEGKEGDVPRLNIVIMIVGSRGDVQPFIALGQRLLQNGHRVRIATHETFKTFVTSYGLEFFNIGGNPQDLMSYMVKNPGLMPGWQSLTNGDIGRKRTMLREMMNGCWRACNNADQQSGEPFAADAIISNPPAFAHAHCAEALGIPLLLSFTMPWSPTRSFPHPLASIKTSNAEKGLSNYLTYALADMLTWQGMGDIVNSLRCDTLHLPALTSQTGPGLVDRMKVPFTYCLSPALVPKPVDWKNYIDIVGFYFMDPDANYEPPADLKAFLDAGEPPIYIGFGSVVVDDPDKMTTILLEAIKTTNIRALLYAGWGGLGTNSSSVPPNVFILDKNTNIPHDWLFRHVSAVVHHGGAGTTAAGLRWGKPTIVVPFFGDQFFWGMMIHRAGGGPEPIPQKELSVDNLSAGLRYVLTPTARRAAERMGEQIRGEDGVANGLQSFYKHLPLLNMRCDLIPSKVAVWWCTKYCLRLSALAAQVLIDAGHLSSSDLDLHRSKEYETRKKATDPFTGGAAAIFFTITHYYGGIAEIFLSNPAKGVVDTTVAIPRGIFNIVTSVHEGIQNAPKLYGSKVRESGKVTDFKSGVKEAGKGFFYGYYDGITGLVREPVEGARTGGFLGAIKGSARSFVNATVKPAGGALSLVALPLQGTLMSLQGALGHGPDRQRMETRVAEGQTELKTSSEGERKGILMKFDQLKAGTKERKEGYKQVAEKVIVETMETVGEERASADMEPTGLSAVPSWPMEGKASGSLDSMPVSSPLDVDEEEKTYKRDIELATQLSLAEQRGYERGIAALGGRASGFE
ncbi:glycosyltransferase family 1 protein [Jaapia argillacea MUCL 33604]|uniref:Glycosyltransferase family 1 protein n=1 Tax=Jaapia argillacea MUCL 33604 TaxID=933084 RepID=A0A067PY93_9AGAM|nr:glycosyltransferase family 1 protein [Jaapia argillacea MUCL 33604]